MSMYKGTQRFDRSQLVFMVAVAVASYVDMVEENLPTTPSEQKDYKLDYAQSVEHTGMRALGWNVSILYAQLTGDGISTGDIIDMTEKTGLRKQMEALIALRFNPQWPGFKQDEPTHPINYEQIAEILITKLFDSQDDDYLRDG